MKQRALPAVRCSNLLSIVPRFVTGFGFATALLIPALAHAAPSSLAEKQTTTTTETAVVTPPSSATSGLSLLNILHEAQTSGRAISLSATLESIGFGSPEACVADWVTTNTGNDVSADDFSKRLSPELFASASNVQLADDTPQPSQQCLDHLNAVRFYCAESNKYDPGIFVWKWQWFLRAKWHIARQATCEARKCVINGNEKITPDDWTAAACAVLDTADAFGQRWGNCAEQASTLAGLIFAHHKPPIWVRVCYSDCHAWTQTTEDQKTVFDLDPWNDTATVAAGDGTTTPKDSNCTSWYRNTGKDDPKWEKK